MTSHEEQFASEKNIRELLLNKRERVNYKELLEGTSVLFIGENHDVIAGKNELLKNLRTMESAGARILALDCFSSELQNEVDAFVKKGEKAKEIKESLRDFPKEHIDAVLKLLDEVRAVNNSGGNLSIACLEVTSYIRSRLRKEFKKDVKAMRQKKEEHIADVITHFIKRSKKAKIVALIPSAYAQSTHVPAKVSKLSGAECRSVKLAGGKKRFAGVKIFYQRMFERACADAGIGEERFMARIDKSKNSPAFHYIIHIPQKEAPGEKEKPLSFKVKRLLRNFLEDVENSVKLALGKKLDYEERF